MPAFPHAGDCPESGPLSRCFGVIHTGYTLLSDLLHPKALSLVPTLLRPVLPNHLVHSLDYPIKQ
jgi:hypothetical protein